ncbi:MAG: hypothetical protein ABIK92_18665 [Pseudomonadota bacterium]
MIVPRYWSESKTKKIVEGRQFTIKRFGWSDLSEQDAKAHADDRLKEAVKTLETEGDVRRIDHKTSYNGAEGIPIREEVISKHQDVIISRNSYGSLCLNTPDVMFADIDFEYEASFKTHVVAFIFLSFCAAIISLFFKSWLALFLSAIAVLVFIPTMAKLIHRMILSLNGGFERKAIETIKKVSIESPELHFRLYRTPLGFRVLLMNDTYSPTSDTAINLLKDLQSDSIYVQMCKNQNCFRARVSPKPWRIGIERIKPQPGVWPIKEERMKDRREWVDMYEKKAKNYSSCHFLMQLGSVKVSPKAEFVRKIHDDLCKVSSSELSTA